MACIDHDGYCLVFLHGGGRLMFAPGSRYIRHSLKGAAAQDTVAC